MKCSNIFIRFGASFIRTAVICVILETIRQPLRGILNLSTFLPSVFYCLLFLLFFFIIIFNRFEVFLSYQRFSRRMSLSQFVTGFIFSALHSTLDFVQTFCQVIGKLQGGLLFIFTYLVLSRDTQHF